MQEVFTNPLLYMPLMALILDLAVGDPLFMFHPVRAVGALLEKQEGLARKIAPSRLKLAGAAFLAVNCVVVALVVKLLVSLPYIGFVAYLYFAYAGLALGQLLREGRKVKGMLAQGRLEDARGELAGLVSRDVSALDEQGLRRTLAETLSENINDGFVAPFFFLTLGGPAFMWLYKIVSTMDSMWGYKNERFAELGWAAAKADDVLAFVPARITAFVMVAAGRLMGIRKEDVLHDIRTDALKTESPNAGWPMAAAAWLLGASMGGAAVYFGEVKEKPVLGPQGEWTEGALDKLDGLLLRTGILAGLAMQVYFFMAYLSAA